MRCPFQGWSHNSPSDKDPYQKIKQKINEIFLISILSIVHQCQVVQILFIMGEKIERDNFYRESFNCSLYKNLQLQVNLFCHLVENKGKVYCGQWGWGEVDAHYIAFFYLKDKIICKKLPFSREKRNYFSLWTIGGCDLWPIIYSIYNPLNCNCVKGSRCKWGL